MLVVTTNLSPRIGKRKDCCNEMKTEEEETVADLVVIHTTINRSRGGEIVDGDDGDGNDDDNDNKGSSRDNDDDDGDDDNDSGCCGRDGHHQMRKGRR